MMAPSFFYCLIYLLSSQLLREYVEENRESEKKRAKENRCLSLAVLIERTPRMKGYGKYMRDSQTKASK